MEGAPHRDEELDALGESTPFDWQEPKTYDVFSPKGDFLGTFRLPHRRRLVEAEGDRIWAVGAGDYDVQFLVQYRIVR